MKSHEGELYVQYGAGACGPVGWQNYDCSPTLRIARLPLIGRLIKSPFPSGVAYGDIVRGLPVADASAKGVYASHVLEHLSRADCLIALRNTLRILQPGGRFRLIVPDLKARAIAYLQAASANDPSAADSFMRATLLGIENSPRGLEARLRRIMGNSSHLWMWDAMSMTDALASVGFTDIRQSKFGDSGDIMFDQVEDLARFEDGTLKLSECALEAFRPRP